MEDEDNNKNELFIDTTTKGISLEDTEETTQPHNKMHAKKKQLQHNLNYDGQTGQLYKLFILDFFMRIITLGIYTFWGRTRLRKYLVSCFSIDGDRFEYTGTGGELFKGFLKVLPILAIILIPLAFVETNPIFVIFYIPLIYCFGIAIYGAKRYRYSRTRWRGISGYLGGSTLKYANLNIWRAFLNIISLSMLKPASDLTMHKYIMNNTYFGNVKAEFNGNSKVLFRAHIKSIFLALATLSVLSVLIGGFIWSSAHAQDYYTSPTTIQNSDTENIDIPMIKTIPMFIKVASGAAFLGIIILPIFIFPLCRSIYTAALMREKMRGLQIGDIKFMCTVGAMDIVKHKSMNLVILMITLGFGYPIIVQRNMKFFMRHNIIMGDLEAFEAKQAQDQGITTGEGLEGMLDLDTGFF